MLILLLTVFVRCCNTQQSRAAGASFRRITYGCSQLLNAADFLQQVSDHSVFCKLSLNLYYMKIWAILCCRLGCVFCSWISSWIRHHMQLL